MTYYIAFGRDTESLEDPDQMVLVGCPDRWADKDNDDLIHSINEGWEGLEKQELVGFQDIVDSLRLIIPTVNGIHPSTSKWVTQQIIDALIDAVDNNS